MDYLIGGIWFRSCNMPADWWAGHKGYLKLWPRDPLPSSDVIRVYQVTGNVVIADYADMYPYRWDGVQVRPWQWVRQFKGEDLREGLAAHVRDLYFGVPNDVHKWHYEEEKRQERLAMISEGFI